MINTFTGVLYRGCCVKYGNVTLKSLSNLNKIPRNSKSLFSSCIVHYQNHGLDGSPRPRKQLPNLFYVQNPITWLINKIDFIMLRKAWDVDFVEEEFKRGVKQAVCTICNLISKNLWDDLKGLVTKKALLRLQRDMQFNWTKEQRQSIAMNTSDIKLVLPRKVHFLKITEKKFVDIDVICVALKLKEEEVSNSDDLILIEVFARFHRNYTKGQIPEWTVTLMKISSQNVHNK